MKLTFIYLNFPFWRAEVGRVALYFGNIKFDSRLIDHEEFTVIKRDGFLNDGTVIPFHQLPCLLVDETSICQTGAIARFCGKLSGFYPADAPLLAAQTDQFIDIATDITELVILTGQNKEPSVKAAERAKLAKDGLARKLFILNKMIAQEGDFILGDTIGLADIAIWRMCGWLSAGLDGIPTDVLSAFPNILRVCKAVDQHPKIMSWVKETYPIGYNRGSFAV